MISLLTFSILVSGEDETNDFKIYLFNFENSLRIEFESKLDIEGPPIISFRIGFLNLPVEFLKSKENIWIYSVNLPSNVEDLDSYPYATLRAIFWDASGNMYAKKFTVQSPFYEHFEVKMEADTFFENEKPFLKITISKPVYFRVSSVSLVNSSAVELSFEKLGNEILAPIPQDLNEENYILKVEIQDQRDPNNLKKLEKRMFYFGGVLIPVDDVKPKVVDKIIVDEYLVKRGDTISYISQKYQISPTSIMLINNLSDPKKLLAGQKIKIGRLLFEPSKIKLLVDLFHSKLYVYYKDHLLKKLPVAVGRADATPPGIYTVMEKRENPTLYWKGEIIPPGSLVNGLGSRWIGLSDPQYGIHGTTKPWEIGRRISHGCIRLRNEDVEKLFEFVPIGTEVMVFSSIDTIPKRLTEEMTLKWEKELPKR